MSPATLAFLLGTGLAWSSLDALRKQLGAHLDALTIMLQLSALQIPFFGIWLLSDGWPSVQSAFWLPSLSVIALNLAASLLFLRAVQISELSRTVPYLSLTPIFTVGAEALMLARWPSEVQTIGIALVLVGAVLLNLRQLRAGQIDRGSLYMIIVALIWSFTPVMDKLATDASSVPFHGASQQLGITLLLMLWVALKGRLRRTFSQSWPHASMLTLTALAATAAMGLQLLTLQVALASVMEAVKRAVGLVMAMILGHLVFKERLSLGKWLAATLMGVGTTLVLEIWGQAPG